MWWSDRRTALLGLAALGGCGFAPAYAPGGGGTLLRNRIEPRAPTNGLEFAFVERVEARLGRAAGGPLVLTYRIDTTEDALAITPDQEIQRYNLVGRMRYGVEDGATGRTLTQGTIDSFTAYSAIGTTVATRASETDAQRRLAVILADRLVTELLAGAGSWAR